MFHPPNKSMLDQGNAPDENQIDTNKASYVYL